MHNTATYRKHWDITTKVIMFTFDTIAEISLNVIVAKAAVY